MFEQAFKNIDDVRWKEAGCTTELDYTEQSSWMLFLKYLDDLEHERALKAELQGKRYEFILDTKHRWSSWAAPKKADGSFDHDRALTGDNLIVFVDRDLFPYLHGFKQRAESQFSELSRSSAPRIENDPGYQDESHGLRWVSRPFAESCGISSSRHRRSHSASDSGLL